MLSRPDPATHDRGNRGTVTFNTSGQGPGSGHAVTHRTPGMFGLHKLCCMVDVIVAERMISGSGCSRGISYLWLAVRQHRAAPAVTASGHCEPAPWRNHGIDLWEMMVFSPDFVRELLTSGVNVSCADPESDGCMAF
ncbi:hypothetical protein Bbelb_150160 [Branchiostoma belcheri]|nr:hypothetical protein Bbelb_150160 [Branchiostoma belcheri]